MRDDIESCEKEQKYVLDNVQQIKKDFVIKVYYILALQLLLTTVVCTNSILIPIIQSFMLDLRVYVISVIVTFVSLCVLNFKHMHYPWNLILLGLFTIAESCILSRICVIYYTNNKGILIISSVFTTSIIFITLSLLTIKTGKDFSFLGNILLIGLMSMLLLSILQLVVMISFMNVLIAWFGVVLFSAFVLHDTSQIFHHMGPDDAISAALMLYLDIINIFILMLDLFRQNSN